MTYKFCDERQVDIIKVGITKQSFSIYFSGGEIWIEHLDALNDETELRQKFAQDMLQISKPSTSAFIAVNLDETTVDKYILQLILDSFITSEKQLRKVVFVGLNSIMKRYIKQQRPNVIFALECIDDFEKAKIWLIGKDENKCWERQHKKLWVPCGE